ncbi:carbohydrate ABC transporter permease [Actinoplanes sp. NPDC049681]|uniref:carbohydrate ABC transporter permease n=1 Tax=Actinoplanes sp. NPDC049681 TaxID=3363905 RepID=UPI0037A11313
MTTTFAVSRRTGDTVAGRTRGRRRRLARRTLTGWAFTGPATIVVVGLSIFPAVWAFGISRTKWNGVTPAVDVGWRNYERLAGDPGLAAAARHSLVLTALFVPASLLLGLLLAIALNQRIRLIGFYRTCIFVPYVASAAATGILAGYVFNPQYGAANDLLRRLGLPAQQFLESPHQALPVVCGIALWGEVGFTTVVYLAALQDIPRELVEAATVDGAGRWQIFRRITMPGLRPVTVFTGVWQCVTALQMFDLIYTTTRGGPMNSTETVVYYMYELAFEARRLGAGAAVACLLFAVTLLMTCAVLWRHRRDPAAWG